ncbi:hypothetical protein B0H13DRAFT_2383851 [Mycena leptocephala]|nr:hypothetical protein B0H13DRAFT_2383851 [Mycena leptocephala]
MSSFDGPLLSQSEQTIVRVLHKTILATHYDDPTDQDAFLTISANSLLQLRAQVASFASTPDLSECVFQLRTLIHRNNSLLKAPSNKTLDAITSFAGEIVHKRQLLRERAKASKARASGAMAAAARSERRAALKLAAESAVKPSSPDEDAVSIPSSDEEPDSPIPPSKNEALPAINTAVSSAPVPVRSHTGLISPLSELEGLLLRVQLSAPLAGQLNSPPLSNPSLPDLEPIVSPLSPVVHRNDRVKRKRRVTFPACTTTAPCHVADHTPELRSHRCSNTNRNDPRPVSAFHLQQLSFDGGLPMSRLRSGGLPVPTSTSAGNSKSLRTRHPKARKPALRNLNVASTVLPHPTSSCLALRAKLTNPVPVLSLFIYLVPWNNSEAAYFLLPHRAVELAHNAPPSLPIPSTQGFLIDCVPDQHYVSRIE